MKVKQYWGTYIKPMDIESEIETKGLQIRVLKGDAQKTYGDIVIIDNTGSHSMISLSKTNWKNTN